MGISASGLEVEVKLSLSTREEAINRLEGLHAAREGERHFEDNDIYDTPDGILKRGEKMLRLRVAAGEVLVTYKERVHTDLRAKVRREVQTSVGSAEAMREIFSRLGLVRVYRYQKYRTYYGWNDPETGERLAIALDDTPIGTFLELEGPKESIDRAARQMGCKEDDYILDDYRTLHLAWLEQRGLPPRDLVFAPETGA